MKTAFAMLQTSAVPWVFWVMLALAMSGLVMLASATAPGSSEQGGYLLLISQRLQYFGLGILLAVAVLSLPMHWWQKVDWLLLLGLMGLLLLTWILDDRVNGAARWLKVGGLSLQASELAKFVLPIYIAGYCTRRASRGQLGWARGFYPLVITVCLISLIILQPDFGTAALLFLVVLGMLFVAGMRLLQLSFLLSLGLAIGWLLIAGSEYRMQRWLTFVNPFGDPLGAGWQMVQSMVAFGRGGFFGEGVGESVQKIAHLPEAHNDYILAILAEEMGFLGVFAILLGFFLIAFRAFDLASNLLRREESFAGYLVLGIGFMLIVQVLFNAYAVTGLLPSKGIVLPLFSAGGSSLLATLICFAFLLRAEAEYRSAGTDWS